MTVRSASLLSLSLALSCGGGNVDPGFYGPVEEQRPPPASSATAPAAEQARAELPRVVLIRASWCAACLKAERALFPVLAEQGEKLDVVVLDVSDDDAIRSSRQIAYREGVSAYFESHRGVTPSVGLVGSSGRVRHYEGNPFRRESWQRAVGELLDAERHD